MLIKKLRQIAFMLPRLIKEQTDVAGKAMAALWLVKRGRGRGIGRLGSTLAINSSSKGMTNPRPQGPQLSPAPEIHDVDDSQGEAGNPGRRLVCNHRPQGCLISDSHLIRSQRVPKIHLQGQDLRTVTFSLGSHWPLAPSPDAWTQSLVDCQKLDCPTGSQK